MEKELKTREIKNLWKALLKLDSEKECEQFFRDIATFSEIQALAERWQVAQMVDKGQSYREINKTTGVSTTTITRVAHWLHHGMGGYRLVLDRMKK